MSLKVLPSLIAFQWFHGDAVSVNDVAAFKIRSGCRIVIPTMYLVPVGQGREGTAAVDFQVQCSAASFSRKRVERITVVDRCTGSVLFVPGCKRVCFSFIPVEVVHALQGDSSVCFLSDLELRIPAVVFLEVRVVHVLRFNCVSGDVEAAFISCSRC